MYVTVRTYGKNKGNGNFNRDDDGVIIHHCEMMKLLLEYSKFLDRIANSPASSSKEMTSKRAHRIEKVVHNDDDSPHTNYQDTKWVRKKRARDLGK